MKEKSKKGNPGKSVVSEIKEEFKRHTNVLMEQMRHEVKTVAEGHGTIMRKLGEHDTRFTGIDQRLTRVEMVTTDINGRLKTVENKVDNVDNRLKTVERKLDENLDNHEKRITKLEEKVLS